MKFPKRARKQMSVSIRLPLLFIVSFLLIIIAVVLLVYRRFEKRTVQECSEMGISAAHLMADAIDADKTQQYIDENFEMEEYCEIREHLIFLKENYPDAMYMYVFRFTPDYAITVFDLDSEYIQDAFAPGELYEPDPAIVPYMDTLYKGGELPILTGDTEDGYTLTYMMPVFDSSGDYAFHVGVDFSMEQLHQDDLAFVKSMLAILLLIILLVALLDVHITNLFVSGPLNRMKHTTDRFAYESEADHENNIRIMEELNIRTGDEIEDIYRLFVMFMKNNLAYMKSLDKAESDIKSKDAQIGQISQEAYRDSLTNVGSKAAYTRKIAELNSRIAEGMHEIAVVMVDMNDLKRINDKYGHKAGDTYIKGCCKLICDTFKHSPVFRIGGDEFVAILMGGDYAIRAKLAEQIRADFAAAYSQEELDPWLRYSASVGMAELSSEDNSFELMFKRADQAMYAEKQAFKELHGSYR